MDHRTYDDGWLVELVEAMGREPNHGRRSTAELPHRAEDGRGARFQYRLGDSPEADFAWGGGATIVDTARGTSWGPYVGSADAGMVGHRGILRGDEWIDGEALLLALERQLGQPYGVILDVYGPRRGGPLPVALRQARNALDTRLAAVTDEGGIARLARLIGVSERTLQRAAERGRRANCRDSCL